MNYALILIRHILCVVGDRVVVHNLLFSIPSYFFIKWVSTHRYDNKNNNDLLLLFFGFSVSMAR